MLRASAALPLLLATEAYAQSDNASDRAKERAKVRAEKVMDYWTPERVEAAQPRDMVIDHRSLAYRRGKGNSLKPHGHKQAAELTASTKRVKMQDTRIRRAKPGSDRTLPTVTNTAPGRRRHDRRGPDLFCDRHGQ